MTRSFGLCRTRKDLSSFGSSTSHGVGRFAGGGLLRAREGGQGVKSVGRTGCPSSERGAEGERPQEALGNVDIRISGLSAGSSFLLSAGLKS